MSTTGGDDPARQSLKFSTLTEDDIKSKNKRDLIILLTEAREEINVLTQALAVKAGDIGLERDGDLRSVLLYDLAQCQQARASLALDLARRAEKIKELQKVVTALSFIRESNNQELIKSERRILELEQQCASYQAHAGLAAQNQEKLASLVSLHHEQLEKQEKQHQSLRQRQQDHHQAELTALQAQYEQQLQTTLQKMEHRKQHFEQQSSHHQQQTLGQKSHFEQQLLQQQQQHQQQLEHQQMQNEEKQAHNHQLLEQQQKQIEELLEYKKQQQNIQNPIIIELKEKIAILEAMPKAWEKEKERTRTDHDAEKKKLQDSTFEHQKQIEVLKLQISQLKGREGETHSKLSSLRAEFARQGRMNSFQEVVGTQMANVRSQLDEAKQMYERVSAENSTLAAENARLLLLLNEEIKAKSDTNASHLLANQAGASSGSPTSTPPLSRTSSFIDLASRILTSSSPSTAPEHSQSPPLPRTHSTRGSTVSLSLSSLPGVAQGQVSSPLSRSLSALPNPPQFEISSSTSTSFRNLLDSALLNSPQATSSQSSNKQEQFQSVATAFKPYEGTTNSSPSPTLSTDSNSPSSKSQHSISKQSPLLARRRALKKKNSQASLSSSPEPSLPASQDSSKNSPSNSPDSSRQSSRQSARQKSTSSSPVPLPTPS